MDNIEVNFDAMISDMSQLLENQEEMEDCVENKMCEYSMKYTSIDETFEYHFTFDQRENCPPDILELDGFDEVIADLTIADIELDESNTKDEHGVLLHAGCLKIQFSFETGEVLLIDGIEYEPQEDNGVLFTEYVMPVVIDYVKMGTIELLGVTEYED